MGIDPFDDMTDDLVDRVQEVAPMYRTDRERDCWLVGQKESGELEVVKAKAVGDPTDGIQTVRVGAGCGIWHSIPIEKVHWTKESADAKMAALYAEAGVEQTPK